MRRLVACLLAVFASLACGTAHSAVFTFATDPFEGSTAPITPGRQVVGGEPSISFATATDVFAFLPAAFGIPSQLSFASGPVGSLPTSGVNVIVLQTFDDDANPATPFAAGNAANLIAAQLNASGPGFFIYFNQGLNLPRLVFSTDLNDPTADLKILARMVNFTGQQQALALFTAQNFALLVPEPASLALIGVALLAFALRRRR